MKHIFSVFLTFCVFQIGCGFPVQKFKVPKNLTELENVIENYVSDLELYGDDSFVDLFKDAEEIKFFFINRLNDTLNRVLAESEIEKSDVMEKGLDIESCYRNASEEINKAFSNLTTEFNNCDEMNIWPTYFPVSEDTEYFHNLGIEVHKRIETVINHCKTKSIAIMEQEYCLTHHRSAVEILANGIKYLYKELKALTVEYKYEAYEKGEECYSAVELKAENNLKMIVEKNIACVDKLHSLKSLDYENESEEKNEDKIQNNNEIEE